MYFPGNGKIILYAARSLWRPGGFRFFGSLIPACGCSFDVEGHVTGFGNPTWKATHEKAKSTAPAVTALLRNGATLVGKTHMDELAFR